VSGGRKRWFADSPLQTFGLDQFVSRGFGTAVFTSALKYVPSVPSAVDRSPTVRSQGVDYVFLQELR
jgi:hypothetical protein